MKKIFLLIMVLTAVMAVDAQKPVQELKENASLSASNFTAYPGPTQWKLTPPPAGMKPFYLSHYGRHGSRYMSKMQEYDKLLDVLQQGERLHVLTPLGEDVLQRVTAVCKEAEGRLGELTPLGREQMQMIAKRMVERFPEVFEGTVTVDARSTLYSRCILSMEFSLLQMVKMNPRLNIVSDASASDQSVLSFNDKELMQNILADDARKAFDAYCRSKACWERVIGQLFTDTAFVNSQIDGERLNYYLFRMASTIQNMEVRKQLTFYDLFTDEEIYMNWQATNAYWFMGYGYTQLNGNKQPFMQRRLLRRIISDADSCLKLKHPGATLRFGHDTVLLPLVCLMGLNGYDKSIRDLNYLEKRGWVDYRVFPMAANMQIVFYRKSPGDSDVLLKVLLNENEATLPLPADQAPYYRWSDFKEYYMKLLDSYEENNQ
ncbi:MAG: histidine-type phosphatase [Prevotella sp.]|nr:histidine-type phosphatase [Prevotella sp.]